MLHKVPVGVTAGALFVIPSMFVLFALSYVYLAYDEVSWVASIFSGLKPAVLAIITAAVIKIARKALGNSIMITTAALS